MNCCDEYGNCNQGRDCPCRKNPQPLTFKEKLWAYGSTVLATLGFMAMCLAIIAYFGSAK